MAPQPIADESAPTFPEIADEQSVARFHYKGGRPTSVEIRLHLQFNTETLDDISLDAACQIQ